MVNLISLGAIVLPALFSVAAQHTGNFILEAGQLKGHHTINNIICSGSVLSSLAQEPLKAGHVFCSYLPTVDMSLCQCHQSDVTVETINRFTRDILFQILTTGICIDKNGGVDYANADTWLSGHYADTKSMSAATFSQGKVTTNSCRPVRCSHASKGLWWRNLAKVPAKC